MTAQCLCLSASVAMSAQAADETAGRPGIVGIAGSHYIDNDRNKSSGFNADVEMPAASYDLFVKAMGRFAEDHRGGVNMESFVAGVRHALSKNLIVDTGAGAAVFEDVEHPTFAFNLKWKSDLVDVQASIERTPLYQTATILRNELMFLGFDSKVKVHLIDRFEPKVEISLRSYSDNNASMRLRGDLPATLLANPVKLTVGYRQEHATFRRQSGSGYFDPDSLNSFQGVMTLSGAIAPFSLYLEVFGGAQTVDRFGTSTSDNFAGIYSYARLDRVGPLAFILEAEASDYALSSESGFRYLQLNLRAETSW